MPSILSRYWDRMVFIWGSGWGPRRRRGYGPGFGGPGYGPGYGPPPGYGYRRGYGGGGGGGGCPRGPLLLHTRCCPGEALGCGIGPLLLGPASPRAGPGGARGAPGRPVVGAPRPFPPGV